MILAYSDFQQNSFKSGRKDAENFNSGKLAEVLIYAIYKEKLRFGM
jgi:hypothetical protein